MGQGIEGTRIFVAKGAEDVLESKDPAIQADRVLPLPTPGLRNAYQ